MQKTKNLMIAVIASISLLSCTESTITVEKRDGKLVTFQNDNLQQENHIVGDSLRIIKVLHHNKLQYLKKVPFNLKKGEKMTDGSVYIGTEKVLIKSIHHNIQWL